MKLNKLKFKKHNGGVSEGEIFSFEEKFGIVFPSKYREFLLKYNGCKPERNLYEYEYYYNDLIKGKNNFELVELDPLSELDITMKELPENIIGIGFDSQGNPVVLSVSGSDRGKIYYCDNTLKNYENPDYSNLFLLANDFESFLNGFSYPYDNRFMEYAEKGNLKKIEKLVENGFDINTKRLHTNTPIVYDLFQIETVKNKQDELYNLISMIIKKGLDTKNGILTIVSAHGDEGLPFAKLFLEYGSDVNELGGYGSNKKTPLINASFSGSETLVKVLLDNGANPFQKDYEGKTARDWIKRRIDRSFPKINNLLLEAERNWKG